MLTVLHYHDDEHGKFFSAKQPSGAVKEPVLFYQEPAKVKPGISVLNS
jgi:hypothetical protein